MSQSGTGAAETCSTPDQGIAVIGMSCRFPQAADPEAFWTLLRDGVSAITDVPADRWDVPSERPDMRRGGFLDQVDRFDPAFFGISPREAAAIDPQQRLVLELGWEALEHAGLIASRLRGSRTGVFVGAIWDDYATLLHRQGPGAISHFTATGLHRSIIANRLSHALGLGGPSLTVDCGQSSSLAAVHLACRSLLSGESELALAGGVNLNLRAPGTLPGRPLLHLRRTGQRLCAGRGRWTGPAQTTRQGRRGR
jgi:acyl transferase domain-containing protein